MRPTGTFLTEKFFIYYGLLQLTGVFGLEFHFLFWIYAFGLLTFVLLAYFDRQSLLEKISEAVFHPSENMMLFEDRETAMELLPSEGAIHQKNIYVELPVMSRIHHQRSVLTREQSHDGKISFKGVIRLKGLILGTESLSQCFAFSDSNFGLWMRVVKVKLVPLMIQIHPRLKKISEQEFSEIARQNQLLLGHRLKMRGQGADQYYTSRKFQYPDSLRYIDQKRTAKLGEIMTKTFEEMRNHRLVIALDVGRGMSGEIAGSSKQDFYLAAALSLAKNAIESRDAVDFFAFSQKVHLSVANVRSLYPLRSLVEKAETLRVRMEETNYGLLPKMISHLTGQRSIVVVLTDLSRPSIQRSLLSSLSSVCRKHLVVTVGLIDNDFSLDTQILNFREPKMSDHDVSSLLYNYWLHERLRIFQTQMTRIGGASLNLSEEKWMSVVERLYGGLRQSVFS